METTESTLYCGKGVLTLTEKVEIETLYSNYSDNQYTAFRRGDITAKFVTDSGAILTFALIPTGGTIFRATLASDADDMVE